jgi:hypothetical protein
MCSAQGTGCQGEDRVLSAGRVLGAEPGARRAGGVLGAAGGCSAETVCLARAAGRRVLGAEAVW